MTTKITQRYIDHSREFSASSFHVEDLDATNYAAVVASAQAIQTQLAVISLLNFTTLSMSQALEEDTPVTPASNYAQREGAAWVQYVDTVTGNYHSLQIPGPDLTLIAQVNTDEIDISSNVTALAFIAAFEANAVAPDTGNPVEVSRMRYIGRRS